MNAATRSGHLRRAMIGGAMVIGALVVQGPLSGPLAHAGVTPRPEAFTELAFADPSAAVDVAAGVDVSRKVAFVVANHEGRSRRYLWVVRVRRGEAITKVASGAVRVSDGRSVTVATPVSWRRVPTGAALEVVLPELDQVIRVQTATTDAGSGS